MRGFICDVLDVFSPTTCPGCEGQRWGRQASTWCPRCVETLPAGLVRVYPTPEHVGLAWGYAPYRGIVGAGIRRGKYRPDPVTLSELGRWVGVAAKCHTRDFDVVAPVPQSLSSTIARGFSPVGILAACIAREVGLPFQEVLRCGPGIAQVSLSKPDRRSNVQGRYSVRKPLLLQRVFLVDDVITTGATASECGRVLRSAGAAEVAFLGVTVATRI